MDWVILAAVMALLGPFSVAVYMAFGVRGMLRQHAREMHYLRQQLRLYDRFLSKQSGPLKASNLFVYDGPGEAGKTVVVMVDQFAMSFPLHPDEVVHFIRMLRGEVSQYENRRFESGQ